MFFYVREMYIVTTYVNRTKLRMNKNKLDLNGQIKRAGMLTLLFYME